MQAVDEATKPMAFRGDDNSVENANQNEIQSPL